MYHVISHIYNQNLFPIYGPFHVLVTFLNQQKKDVASVTLPLELEGEYSYTWQGVSFSDTTKVHTSIIYKYFYDTIFLFSYLIRNPVTTGDTVIAIDPLNAFVFSLLSYVKKFSYVYYTVDYSENRFDNLFLNKVYTLLDNFALSRCDQNWCVSQRIVEKRISDGADKQKIKFVPNTPVLPFSPSIQDVKNKHALVYVGRIDSNMHLIQLLDAVKLLRKKDKKITLDLVGGGPLKAKILNYIEQNKLKSSVTYHGPLKNEDVIELIKKSGIGIALYDGGNNWNRYGDSMKIREYQYAGLPVVTTSIPSNSIEVEQTNCGFVLDEQQLTSEQIVRAVEKIQKDYLRYSEQTLKLVKKRDKSRILTKLLKGS